MKVKGIVNSGSKKGSVIELSPDEKVLEAVKEGVTGTNDLENIHWVEGKIRKLELNTISAGQPLRGLFVNNYYEASGEVSITRSNAVKDKKFPRKPYSFVVVFQDVLDSWGQPDLKIEKFELTKVE